MKVFELFSGTGSVGDACREVGFEAISLDRDMEADIKTDIMDWGYTTFPPKHFDLIWASPPLHGIQRRQDERRQGHRGLQQSRRQGDGDYSLF